uniref:Mitoferrin n=1 Tax=Strigamia maritima TaxID=126957 RepID=T1ISH4_STRMM
MMAGSMAGIGEHCVMYPFDCVKTRMQSMQPSPHAAYKSIPDALFKMVRYEGLFRPMRGMSAVMTGAGPAHAMYYSCYEKLKEMFTADAEPGHHVLAHGAAGCFSTLLHDAVMNPVEVIKQRMQMFNSPFKRCRECLLYVYNVEGPRAFYRSYTTQLTMNVPYQSLHFMMYEYMQDLTNADRHYNPKAHMMSGAIAGAFAAAATTPLDVCKTLLNTQEKTTLQRTKQTQIRGLVHAVQVVYQLRGLRGYFRGLQPRVLFQMPATAIAWSVYEFFKFFLSNRHNHISAKEKVMEKYPPSITSKTSPVNMVSDFQSSTKAAVTVAAATNP